jgi:hypothetical protein
MQLYSNRKLAKLFALTAALALCAADIGMAQVTVVSARTSDPNTGLPIGYNPSPYGVNRSQAIINRLNQNLNAINQGQNAINNTIQDFGNSLQQQFQQDAEYRQQQLQQEQQQREQDRLDRLQQQQEQQQQADSQNDQTGVTTPSTYQNGQIVSPGYDNGGVTTPLIFQNGQVISPGYDNGGVQAPIQFGGATVPAVMQPAPPAPATPPVFESLSALFENAPVNQGQDLVGGAQGENSIISPSAGNTAADDSILDPADDDSSTDVSHHGALLSHIAQDTGDLADALFDKASDYLKSGGAARYIEALAAQIVKGEDVKPVDTAVKQVVGDLWQDATEQLNTSLIYASQPDPIWTDARQVAQSFGSSVASKEVTPATAQQTVQPLDDSLSRAPTDDDVF